MKYRKLTKEEKIQLWAEIEGTSLGSFVEQENAFLDGTELEPMMKRIRRDLNRIRLLHNEYSELVGT